MAVVKSDSSDSSLARFPDSVIGKAFEVLLNRTGVSNVTRDIFMNIPEMLLNESESFQYAQNSNGSNESAPIQNAEFPRYIVVTSTVFYVMIFLLGVIGNIIVMVVVCCNRNMKTSVNMYLMNLCTADILVLTVCMPTALADLFTKEAWYFGAVMCKLVPFLENTVANASVLTILAISIERYRVVNKPLKGIGVDGRKVAKVIAVLWFVSAACSIPSLYIAILKQSYYLDGTPILVCRNPITKKWQRTYITLLSLLFFALPFLSLAILYCRVCYVLHRNQNTMNGGIGDAQHHKDRKRLQLQVINILSSIVILFFFCHLPFRAIGLWMIFEDREVLYSLGIEKYFNILYFGRIMFYMNHAVNPIIYNFVSSKFRSTFRHMVTGRGATTSYVSSNRRHNHLLPVPRLNRSAQIANGNSYKRDVRRQTPDGSHSSTTPRQNRNEFFPMYAHIIEGSTKSKNESSSTSSSAANDGRCSLHIKLIDKSVALTFTLRKKRRNPNSKCSQCVAIETSNV